MTPVRHQREVENRMREAVRQDRARIQLGRISRFGLLEMSRQRLRPSIGETSQGICPRCNGTGHVRGVESLALSVLRLMEEEAIKDNTQHVQAQVPVPVATYLLNEKRRSVFHIEKHHKVHILIIPNPHMDTPQYEVIRVRKDETIDEASYDLTVTQATVEEAVMPKFNKEAAKRDEPALQGMSAPKKSAPGKEKQAPQVKAKAKESKGFFAWLKGLFVSEEVVEEKPAEKRKPRRSNERRSQRGKQGQRNNKNRQGQNQDKRNANKGDAKDEKQNKQGKQQRKPQGEKSQKPKEEKVAERRQRRSNRKKVRVNDGEQKANKDLQSPNTAKHAAKADKAGVNSQAVEAGTTNDSPAEVNAKEERPRNRRSPRHLRSHGQRRRRQEGNNENAPTKVEQNIDDPIEARYPEAEESQVIESNVVKSVDSSEATETIDPAVEAVANVSVEVKEAIQAPDEVEKKEVQQDLPLEIPVEASESKSTVSESANSEKVADEPLQATESTTEESAPKAETSESLEASETSSSTPVEDDSSVAEEVSDNTAVAAEIEQISQEPVATTEVNKPLKESKQAIKEDKPIEEQANGTDGDSTEASNDETAVEGAATKEAVSKEVEVTEKPKAKKAKTKSTKLPKSKLAKRTRASSPMAKPETINTVNELPTAFFAADERVSHPVSGRAAKIEDVRSRSQSGMTKAQ